VGYAGGTINVSGGTVQVVVEQEELYQLYLFIYINTSENLTAFDNGSRYRFNLYILSCNVILGLNARVGIGRQG
jgi:hypothetical protein